MTGAIQAVISTQSPAQSTHPYAEYFTGFDIEKDRQSQELDLTEQLQADASSSISGEQQTQIEGADTPEFRPQETSTPVENQQRQFEDMKGTVTEPYKTPLQIAALRAKGQRKHYFYPNIPPKSFGRGEIHDLQDWLEDNPQCTEADFFWLRQNSDQIPPFSAKSRPDNNSYLTEDEDQFNDAF